MCGFFIGLFLAVLAMKAMRRGRCFRGHGPRRFGHHRGAFRRRRRFLDWIYERLDTTHGQEKVIADVAEEIENAVRHDRGLPKKHLRDLAGLFRGADFDHEAVAEVWTEQDQALERIRMAVLSSLQRVHEVLEPRQREEVADLLERRLGASGSW